MVFGIGCGLVFTPASTAPARWFAKRRGLATGTAIAGVGVGGLVISPVTEHLLNTVGVKTTLRITALYIVTIGGIAGLFVFCPYTGAGRKTPSMREAFTWKIFKQPRFVLHCLMCWLAMTTYLIPYTFFSGKLFLCL